MKLKGYYDKYLKKEGEGICLSCGKETTYVDITVGYLKFCSNKCSNNSKEVQNKKDDTCYKNHGYRHPYQSPEIRSKIQKELKYDGLNFDSGWEIQYYIWLKDHNVRFEYQPNHPFKYIVDGKEKYYHPDFLILDKNEFIEIKSSRAVNNPTDFGYDNMSPEKLQCILDNTTLLTEKSKELKEVFKYINEKYNLNNGRKTFIKELKKGNIK